MRALVGGLQECNVMYQYLHIRLSLWHDNPYSPTARSIPEDQSSSLSAPRRPCYQSSSFGLLDDSRGRRSASLQAPCSLTQHRPNLADRGLLGEYAGTVAMYRRGARSRAEVPGTLSLVPATCDSFDPCSSDPCPSGVFCQEERQRCHRGPSIVIHCFVPSMVVLVHTVHPLCGNKLEARDEMKAPLPGTTLTSFL